MSKMESYASVWDAIADTRQQAVNLRVKAELMQQMGPIIITVPSFTRACETALPVFRKGSLFD